MFSVREIIHLKVLAVVLYFWEYLGINYLFICLLLPFLHMFCAVYDMNIYNLKHAGTIFTHTVV